MQVFATFLYILNINNILFMIKVHKLCFFGNFYGKTYFLSIFLSSIYIPHVYKMNQIHIFV